MGQRPRDKGDPHMPNCLLPIQAQSRDQKQPTFSPDSYELGKSQRASCRQGPTVGGSLPLVLLHNGSLKPQGRLGGARGWERPAAAAGASPRAGWVVGM